MQVERGLRQGQEPQAVLAEERVPVPPGLSFCFGRRRCAGWGFRGVTGSGQLLPGEQRCVAAPFCLPAPRCQAGLVPPGGDGAFPSASELQTSTLKKMKKKKEVPKQWPSPESS